MAKVVIYGNGQVAGLAHYFLTNDSEHQVVAFTVDREFVRERSMHGLPVVPLDEVRKSYHPDGHRMFVAMGYGRVNRDREERYLQTKALGYDFVTSRASGVVAARCNYADAYKFQHRESDVPEAVRDFVLVPSADGKDAALIVIDEPSLCSSSGTHAPCSVMIGSSRFSMSVAGE